MGWDAGAGTAGLLDRAERDEPDRHGEHERDEAEDRGLSARPLRLRRLLPPRRSRTLLSITPTANLSVFSGTRASGACATTPATSTTTNAAPAPIAARPTFPCVLPNVTTMNATSSPSRNTPLNETVNEYQSCDAVPSLVFQGRHLGAEDRVLVVQRLEPAGAEDRLAQPLEAEDEQDGPDDDAERVDGDVGERRAEDADDEHERGERGRHAPRAPSASRA